jgi:hypothetical protein
VKFFSKFNPPPTVSTCAGNRYRARYKRVTRDDGSWHLVKVDEVDIQKLINSAAPPCIADILNRARRGDDTLLNARTGEVYEDVSRISTDFGSVLDLSVRNSEYINNCSKAIQDASAKASKEKAGNNSDNEVTNNG